MPGGSTLETLAAGLRGDPLDAADWPAVIALANHTLLTPALFASLDRSGRVGGLPAEVGEYLRFIHDCNRDRNRRLSAQLGEVVAALNRRGVVPLLLKGAVPLFLASDDRFSSRMTSDLDLAVEATEEPLALACLAELGYGELEGDRGMARARDAGPVEIRRTARPAGVELPAMVDRAGLKVRIDRAHARALHWILFTTHQGRRLLARADRPAASSRSGAVGRARRDRLERASPAGAGGHRAQRRRRPAPRLAAFLWRRDSADCARSRRIRFQSWRRVFTATHPAAGAPLRLIGDLAWFARRLSQSSDLTQRGPADLARRVARTVRSPIEDLGHIVPGSLTGGRIGSLEVRHSRNVSCLLPIVSKYRHVI